MPFKKSTSGAVEWHSSAVYGDVRIAYCLEGDHLTFQNPKSTSAVPAAVALREFNNFLVGIYAGFDEAARFKIFFSEDKQQISVVSTIPKKTCGFFCGKKSEDAGITQFIDAIKTQGLDLCSSPSGDKVPTDTAAIYRS